MKLKEHTRNQKRMYRIHKQDDKIHDLELMISKLQQENKQLKERMEYLERSNNRREDIIIEQRQEISDLEDNWDELKEYLINDINYWQEQEKEWVKLGFINFGGDANSKIIFKKVLDKMQELEQGSDSNVKD